MAEVQPGDVQARLDEGGDLFMCLGRRTKGTDDLNSSFG
jgi:hypothetical protein